jgi:signal transduction histidine kinase
VASQLAIAVRHVRNQERLRGELMTIRETIALSRTLSAARSPKGAARAAARFVSERFRVPVAVWCASDDSPELRLMDVFGVGARRRRELRATMPTLARLGAGASRAREAARERFSATLGVGAPDVVDSGDAVMFVGSSDSPHGGVLDVVGGMLAEALRRRSVEANPDERSHELGLALTAHELRSPLLGVKAALEVMLLEGGGVDHRGDVLARSLDELGQLADLVEGLLGWAVGTRPLRSRTVDLVPLVDEVVRRCDSGGSRVVIHASPTALVHVDPVHMRTAVANLIRNALAYSRTDSKVEVTVEAGAESVELAVRNVGPQVSAEGPSSVFEPLVRNDAIDANPNGSGLGLFIARRVIEAHDGWIWFEPSEDGSTFFVRLPGASREPSSP